MNNVNRREFGTMMAALAAMGSVAEAQESKPEAARLNDSTVYSYAAMKVTHNANGGESRRVFEGTLPTGEFIEVHETTLPAGQMPHPPHKHVHSEMLLIREGKLEVTGEGTVRMAVPGDVVYSASRRMHGLKNVGTEPAKYFVVAVSRQIQLNDDGSIRTQAEG